MTPIQLNVTPIGIKFLQEEEMPVDFSIVKNPQDISYCSLIRLVRDEEEYSKGIIVTKDSIKICKWSRVILGFKKPVKKFEKNIPIILEEPVAGIFLFNINTPKEEHPLAQFIGNPDIIQMIDTQEIMTSIIDFLGIESFTDEYIDQLQTSALAIFAKGKIDGGLDAKKLEKKVKRIRRFNRIWDSKLILNKVVFNSLTWSMKSNTVCNAFAPFLEKNTALYAVCMNTVVIPYLKQKGNVSFIDTGGIAWMETSHKYMVMGLPNDIYKKIAAHLTF